MRMQRCTTLEIVLLNSRERTAGKEEGGTEGLHLGIPQKSFVETRYRRRFGESYERILRLKIGWRCGA